jgi:hypothetical protein
MRLKNRGDEGREADLRRLAGSRLSKVPKAWRLCDHST